MSFDSRCYDLAEIFLLDEPKLRVKTNQLAQAIQDAIEIWIDMENRELEERRVI